MRGIFAICIRLIFTVFAAAELLIACQKESTETEFTVTDIDGNVYNKIRIGSQVWMGENLKTTKLNDGTDIPNVTDTLKWENLKGSGYCWYDNDISNKNLYGVLYNWSAVNTGKLCPEGWHVPDEEDWRSLETFLGGRSVAGGKLKETGLIHWLSPNKGATNESGFTCLPGGRRFVEGQFWGLGYLAEMWSSEPNEGFDSLVYGMTYESGYSGFDYLLKQNGCSVRCLKDN